MSPNVQIKHNLARNIDFCLDYKEKYHFKQFIASKFYKYILQCTLIKLIVKCTSKKYEHECIKCQVHFTL